MASRSDLLEKKAILQATALTRMNQMALVRPSSLILQTPLRAITPFGSPLCPQPERAWNLEINDFLQSNHVPHL